MSAEERGYVYVLYNPMFNTYGECYKIGQTKDIKSRLNSYTTSYPEKCEIKYSKQIKNYKEVERVVHKLLRESRMSSAREFFRCNIENIVRLIEKVCKYTREELLKVLEEKETEKNLKIKNKMYSCEICGSSYTQKQHLNRHMKTSQKCLSLKDIKESIKCIWCNCNFSSKQTFENHENICSVDKEIAYATLLEKYNSLNETHNKYIEEKDKQIKDLQDKLFSIANKTTTTNNTYNI
jgi:hypothetical protein